VGNKIYYNTHPLSKLSDRELRAYEKALEEFMCTDSSMIAMTLKQVRQEIEWRNATHPQGKA
jgi:hypothetical protein